MAVIPIEIVILAIGYILMMFGASNGRFRIMKYLGSILCMVIGVVILYPGIEGIARSSLIALALGTISISLGFYFLIEDSFSHDRQVDHYNQHDDGRFHDDD